jgi:hypothetical protein
LKSPVLIVDSEGAIETAVKIVYKAMKDKKKQEVNLQFLCTSEWMHLQFLQYLMSYLAAKKAKKVEHVKIDIYIEQKEK